MECGKPRPINNTYMSPNWPIITINGVALNAAQSMTVHVALQSLATDLTRKKNPLGKDQHGKFMTKAYLQRIQEINNIYISKD